MTLELFPLFHLLSNITMKIQAQILWGNIFLHLLDVSFRVELLDYIVTVYFFEGMQKCFEKPVPFYNIAKCLFVCLYFTWRDPGVCIVLWMFFVAYNTGHIFLYLLTIESSLVKYLFRFCVFLNWVSLLLLSYYEFFILNTCPIADPWLQLFHFDYSLFGYFL